jgi:hypothetical protein
VVGQQRFTLRGIRALAARIVKPGWDAVKLVKRFAKKIWSFSLIANLVSNGLELETTLLTACLVKVSIRDWHMGVGQQTIPVYFVRAKPVPNVGVRT